MIDEGHFFSDLTDFCNQAVDNDGKHVIVAGLDSDFERNAIGQVIALAALLLVRWCSTCRNST